MRISDWSSDVCSSDLLGGLHECLVDRIEQVVGVGGVSAAAVEIGPQHQVLEAVAVDVVDDEGGQHAGEAGGQVAAIRSEEHTSELQSLMRTSYDVFCLKKKYPAIITTYITNYKS